MRWRPALAAPSLDPAGAVELAQVGLQPGHPLHQAPPVDLELGLARAPGADPTGLLAEGVTAAPQPRQPVAQQRQLDLGPPFRGAGVLGEDVEDHRGAVDGRPSEDLLQVPLLGGREVVVEHHGVGVDGQAHLEELLRLALSEIGGRVRCGPALDDPAGHVGAGRVDQARQLVESGLGGGGGALRERHSHQHDALPDLPRDQGVGEGRLGGTHTWRLMRRCSSAADPTGRLTPGRPRRHPGSPGGTRSAAATRPAPRPG